MRTPVELDAMGPTKWKEGLCHIFAEALQGHCRKGDIAMILDLGRPIHVFLVYGGRAYDHERPGITIGQMCTIWRQKVAFQSFEYAVGPNLRELCFQYEIPLGDDGHADLYSGLHWDRWKSEALALIAADTRFDVLRNQTGK